MSLLLAALLLEAAAAAAPPTLDALLARLRQPPPAATAFVEQRNSALLDQPLLLRGRLARPDADTLVRQVEQPWAERTTISGGEVLVEREGREPRRFALRRAPELEALLASFHGLLAGDRALLERHYRLDLQTHADGWQLTLVPRALRLAGQVEAVRLFGRGGELRCMEVAERDGDRSRMLLAGATGAGGDPAFDAECGSGP